MGHYSTLLIGKHDFHWKYDIPAYLSFLFEKDECYQEIANDDDAGYPVKIGFKTNAAFAIERLDQLGMNWDMLTEIYSFFYDQLKESVIENIQSEIQDKNNDSDDSIIQLELEAALAKFDHFNRKDELKDFVNFFIPMIDVSIGAGDMSVKSIDGKIYKISKDKNADIFNNLIRDPGQFFYEKTLLLPPWIQIIGNLFDYELLQEYTEVISVVEIRLLLEACPADTIVDLQLEDMVDDESEISDFHLTSAQRIIGKIKLYNQFFNSVLDQESVVKDIYYREQLKASLGEISKAKTAVEKGKYLEELLDLIFSSVEGMEVIEKRMSTKDEEIDLVVKNSVSGTFWSSLLSPCFFIECKNWKSKVGTPEVRDFESKINNHRKLVKIGFFVALNGFTKEVDTALKRASREEYHLVLIERTDIEQLISAKISTKAWLEKLITRLH